MAENLNKPSDFTSAKTKGMDLLPPSAFEVKPKASDPWKEIARTTEEMMKLRYENTKLKEAQKATAEPVQVQQQECAPVKPVPATIVQPLPQTDMRYIDELINKQASEISDLKNEIRSLRCSQREEISEMERVLTTKERENVHNLAALETELKAAEDRYDAQVDRLSREHQRETDELTTAVEKLTTQLSRVRCESGAKIEDLEREAAEAKQCLTDTVQSLQTELRSKESLIENQSRQISQLKNYIGETENIPQPADLARKEIETLTNKLKASEGERSNLQSTMQLLNIRLTSVMEILKLQEAELSKSSLEIEKSKKEGLLLTRWREKVFALMVQQKSSDISQRKDEQNWNNKCCDLEGKVSSARNQIDQLTHTLSDRTAELDIERNTNKRLQLELSEAQQLALCLDDRLKDSVSQATALQAFSQSVSSNFEQNAEILSSMFSKLKAYGQRISFASGRVEMIQGLLARKEALVRLHCEDGGRSGGGDAQIPVHDNQLMDATPDSENGAYLRAELEAVTRERDRLTSQIKQDSRTWDEKIQTVRKQYEEDLSNLSEKVSDLECIVREKNQACQQLSEKLDDCQRDLDEANENVEELKTTVAKQEMNMDQLLEDQRKSTEQQCMEQFAEMERKLNDTKREHVKAVVSLRQLERQSGREKERAAEHLQTVEEHYSRQVSSLQEQLRSMEAERNLMMATLRQEGLVGKLKGQRPEPVQLEWEQDEEPVKLDVNEARIPVGGPAESPRENTGSPQMATDDEPLTAVLQDLEYLTSAVLKDPASDSASDQET